MQVPSIRRFSLSQLAIPGRKSPSPDMQQILHMMGGHNFPSFIFIIRDFILNICSPR
jgi:hypothetical protein